MNKNILLKSLSQASRGNFFTIELPVASKEEAEAIENAATELEREGKIKIRECDSEGNFHLHSRNHEIRFNVNKMVPNCRHLFFCKKKDPQRESFFFKAIRFC